MTIEDALDGILKSRGLGECDGSDIGMDGTANLHRYGPDADRILSAVEAALCEYPLTR
jgi:hypothetical protein